MSGAAGPRAIAGTRVAAIRGRRRLPLREVRRAMGPRPGARSRSATLASSRRASSSACIARCSAGSVTVMEANDRHAPMLGPAASRPPTTASAPPSGAHSGPTSPVSAPRRPACASSPGASARSHASSPFRGGRCGARRLRRRHVARSVEHHPYAAWATFAATASRRSSRSRWPGDATPLHVAIVIPPFGFGSGGHEVVFRLTEQLEGWATRCRCGSTIRSRDPDVPVGPAAADRRRFRRWSASAAAPRLVRLVRGGCRRRHRLADRVAATSPARSARTRLPRERRRARFLSALDRVRPRR